MIRFTCTELVLVYPTLLQRMMNTTSISLTGTLLLIFLLFGLSAIPFTYLASLTANTQAKGFTISLLVNLVAGKPHIQ